MPLSAPAVWFLTRIRLPAVNVEVQSPLAWTARPDSVMLPVVVKLAGCLNDKPWATASTYAWLTMSFGPLGVVVIVPVVVAILVNVAAAGTDPPITLLLIVLLVIVNPD